MKITRQAPTIEIHLSNGTVQWNQRLIFEPNLDIQ